MSIHALASLTATYTDSEPEGDEVEDGPLQDDDKKSVTDEDQDVGVEALSSSFRVPNQEISVVTNKVARLVSYQDDTYISDDESDLQKVDDGKDGEFSHVNLPPEPSGRCSPKLQEKVCGLLEKLEKGLDTNNMIEGRKSFRNPSIYEKLILYCGINELGTNYPPNIYDPIKWGKESFYEELAKVQKTEMDKREKERKERAKVEIVSGTAKKVNNISSSSSLDDDLKRRKSKWDQVGTGAPGISSLGMIRPAGLVQPSLTSSATGTRSTVIPAFGSLPKKPRI